MYTVNFITEIMGLIKQSIAIFSV